MKGSVLWYPQVSRAARGREVIREGEKKGKNETVSRIQVEFVPSY
jgi:hypothetical protein